MRGDAPASPKPCRLHGETPKPSPLAPLLALICSPRSREAGAAPCTHGEAAGGGRAAPGEDSPRPELPQPGEAARARALPERAPPPLKRATGGPACVCPEPRTAAGTPLAPATAAAGG